MIVYHGTTGKRADKILRDGFLPKRPSKRVWFAASKGYARGRAKTQARRTRDRAVVLACILNMGQLKTQLGPKRVFNRHGIIAINGKVPVTVIRSHPLAGGSPTSPEELSLWANTVLGLKSYKGVSMRHPGLNRLSQWMVRRVSAKPGKTVKQGEIFDMAKRFLPDYFRNAKLDRGTGLAYRVTRYAEVMLKAEPPHEKIARHEEEALACLEDEKPKRRVRGLKLLARLEDPDLGEWCAIFLRDGSAQVRLEALKIMLDCVGTDAAAIEPLADNADKNVRAAALSVLAKHGADGSPAWFALALKDPEACVRLAAVRQLRELDPKEHKPIFELALYDPNPEVVREARRMTKGKGYAKEF